MPDPMHYFHETGDPMHYFHETGAASGWMIRITLTVLLLYFINAAA